MSAIAFARGRLAARAKMSAAARDDLAANHRAATDALFAVALIHAMPQLKLSGQPVGIDKI